jgi:hypothetical protein
LGVLGSRPGPRRPGKKEGRGLDLKAFFWPRGKGA